MIKMILLLLANQLMLIGGQVLLKFGMQRLGSWSWTWSCIWHGVILNPGLLLGAVLLIVTNLLWLYMLKIYPFSTIYPLTSLGFVFGMLSGMLIFHETVTLLQWCGVVFVLIGCYCIAR